jgi:hypothetical protein
VQTSQHNWPSLDSHPIADTVSAQLLMSLIWPQHVKLSSSYS